jgi:hypothetical protein
MGISREKSRKNAPKSSSLSDLKEIGCKSAWPVHISPLSWAIERLLPGETVKIMSHRDGIPWDCPRPAEFCEQPQCGLPANPTTLRFFKPDRLLAQAWLWPPSARVAELAVTRPFYPCQLSLNPSTKKDRP